MKIKLSLLLALLCLATACNNQKQRETNSNSSNNSSEKIKSTETESDVQITNSSKDNFPSDSNYLIVNEIPSEDQYLQFYDGELYYLGTTDDFDDAREGYLPGYFESKAKEITFNDTGFTFTLDAAEIEFYQEPSAPGISPPENPVWDTIELEGKRHYKATVVSDTIFIETKGFDTRTFVRTDAG